jgi:hypothetical protein
MMRGTGAARASAGLRRIVVAQLDVLHQVASCGKGVQTLVAREQGLRFQTCLSGRFFQLRNLINAATTWLQTQPQYARQKKIFVHFDVNIVITGVGDYV